jgi:hypothetical protein
LAAAFEGNLAWLPVMNKTNVIAFGLDETSSRQQWEREVLDQLSKKWGLDFPAFARDLKWAKEMAPLLDSRA